MTVTLHMDTDQLGECALRLHNSSEEIRTVAQILVVSARSVEWYGPSRDTFQVEMEHLALVMTRMADEGDILAGRMQREADQWLQTDEYFSRQFAQIVSKIISSGRAHPLMQVDD